MAAAIVFSTWVQAGEEIGWRWYALPRLSDRFGLAAASVILGLQQVRTSSNGSWANALVDCRMQGFFYELWQSFRLPTTIVDEL